jgi:hypothetical protein
MKFENSPNSFPKRLALYNALAGLGPVAELNFRIDSNVFRSELLSFEKSWQPYNPRKENPREGLSLTSLDGGLSGIPDLDSLPEYNRIHGTLYGEESFTTPTEAYRKLKSLTPILEQFGPHLGRSHLIRFKAGGHFPPHRDAFWRGLTCYRVLGLCDNCGRNEFVMLINDQKVNLQQGHFYLIDTRLEHSFFSFASDCTIVVLNIMLHEDAVAKLMDAVHVR